MPKKFTRRIEDFVCSKCGLVVHGSGYTDHCPQCLWSKHVDVNPGDRLADCGGEMEPVGLDRRNGKEVINYVCRKCRHAYRVKVAASDDPEALIVLARKIAGKRAV